MTRKLWLSTALFAVALLAVFAGSGVAKSTQPAKAGATGGPQCTGLPHLPFEAVPPYVVADTGTNPWRRTYPGVILNSDLIKQIMFGGTEVDGPPRNSSQVGQPG